MKTLILKTFLFSICAILLGCNVSTLTETIAGAVQPLPTVTPNYINLSIRQSLISSDNNCKLPCFMGLRPGETTLKELEKSLSNVRNTPFKSTYFDGGVTYETILSQRSNGVLDAAFIVRNNQLDSIHFIISQSTDWLPKNIFLLPNLLDTLGEPDDVFVAISGPPLSFTMVVVYNHAGVMIRYRVYFKEHIAHRLENTDDPFLICLTADYVDQDYLDAWLINPQNDNLVENELNGLRDSDRDIRPFWTIEKMVGINMQQFTDFYVKNPQSCLEAPSLKELRAEGYVF